MGVFLFQWVVNIFSRLRQDESGQDLTEYGMMVAFIAIVVVLAIVFFGEQVSAFIGDIGTSIGEWLS